MVIVETARLKLREWTLDDVAHLANIYADPEVMRYIRQGLPYSYAQTESYVTRAIEHGRKYGYEMWAAELKDSGEIIGQCGLKFSEELQGTEIGYLLAKKYWGQGLAIEAAKAVIDYSFERLKLDKLFAVIQPENLASIKVVEKLGMTKDKSMLLDGQPILVFKIGNH